MAFMGEDSWKSGLSAAQIAKISTLENQRDGFKSELAKKAYNFDILQQNLEKEKRKVNSNFWPVIVIRGNFNVQRIRIWLSNVDNELDKMLWTK